MTMCNFGPSTYDDSTVSATALKGSDSVETKSSGVKNTGSEFTIFTTPS